MQCHRNKSYLLISLKYFNFVYVLIYNYFAPKMLFCQTIIFLLKFTKFFIVPYYPPGLNMALVCNCTTKP